MTLDRSQFPKELPKKHRPAYVVYSFWLRNPDKTHAQLAEKFQSAESTISGQLTLGLNHKWHKLTP